MLRHLRVGFLLIVSSCSPHSQSSPGRSTPASDSAQRARDERDILAAEHEWVRVALECDADGFATFLADGCVALHFSGQLTDKIAWTERIRAGTTRYDAVELRAFVSSFPLPTSRCANRRSPNVHSARDQLARWLAALAL